MAEMQLRRVMWTGNHNKDDEAMNRNTPGQWQGKGEAGAERGEMTDGDGGRERRERRRRKERRDRREKREER